MLSQFMHKTSIYCDSIFYSSSAIRLCAFRSANTGETYHAAKETCGNPPLLAHPVSQTSIALGVLLSRKLDCGALARISGRKREAGRIFCVLRVWVDFVA